MEQLEKLFEQKPNILWGQIKKTHIQTHIKVDPEASMSSKKSSAEVSSRFYIFQYLNYQQGKLFVLFRLGELAFSIELFWTFDNLFKALNSNAY